MRMMSFAAARCLGLDPDAIVARSKEHDDSNPVEVCIQAQARYVLDWADEIPPLEIDPTMEENRVQELLEILETHGGWRIHATEVESSKLKPGEAVILVARPSDFEPGIHDALYMHKAE